MPKYCGNSGHQLELTSEAYKGTFSDQCRAESHLKYLAAYRGEKRRERDSKSFSTFSPPIENPDARKEADLSERGSCNSASW